MRAFPIDVDDDGTPSAALEVAAQAVRAFNHRSAGSLWRGRAAWECPSDVNRALGDVSALVHRLPQALRQIDAAIRNHLDDGCVGVDRGSDFPDTATAVAVSAAALDHAQRALARLAMALDDACNATAVMHHIERSGPR